MEVPYLDLGKHEKTGFPFSFDLYDKRLIPNNKEAHKMVVSLTQVRRQENEQ